MWKTAIFFSQACNSSKDPQRPHFQNYRLNKYYSGWICIHFYESLNCKDSSENLPNNFSFRCEMLRTAIQNDRAVNFVRKQIVTGQIFVSKPPHISFAIWTCIISPKGHFSILFLQQKFSYLACRSPGEVKYLIWETERT